MGLPAMQCPVTGAPQLSPFINIGNVLLLSGNRLSSPYFPAGIVQHQHHHQHCSHRASSGALAESPSRSLLFPTTEVAPPSLSAKPPRTRLTRPSPSQHATTPQTVLENGVSSPNVPAKLDSMLLLRHSPAPILLPVSPSVQVSTLLQRQVDVARVPRRRLPRPPLAPPPHFSPALLPAVKRPLAAARPLPQPVQQEPVKDVVELSPPAAVSSNVAWLKLRPHSTAASAALLIPQQKRKPATRTGRASPASPAMSTAAAPATAAAAAAAAPGGVHSSIGELSLQRLSGAVAEGQALVRQLELALDQNEDTVAQLHEELRLLDVWEVNIPAADIVPPTSTEQANSSSSQSLQQQLRWRQQQQQQQLQHSHGVQQQPQQPKQVSSSMFLNDVASSQTTVMQPAMSVVSPHSNTKLPLHGQHCEAQHQDVGYRDKHGTPHQLSRAMQHSKLQVELTRQLQSHNLDVNVKHGVSLRQSSRSSFGSTMPAGRAGMRSPSTQVKPQASLLVQQKDLTMAIKSARTLIYLQRLLKRYGHTEMFNAIHVCTCMAQLAWLAPTHLYRYKKVLPGTKGFRARRQVQEIANTCESLAHQHILALSPQGVLTLLDAYAKLHMRSPILGDLIFLCQPVLAEEALSGKDISNLLHAMAVLQLRPPTREWLAALWRCSEAQLPSCDARTLTTVIWSLAKLQLPPRGEWLQAFKRAVAKQASTFNHQGLANLLQAMAQLQLKVSKEQLHQLLKHSTELGLTSFSTQGLVTLFWGAAKLCSTGGSPGASVSPTVQFPPGWLEASEAETAARMAIEVQARLHSNSFVPVSSNLEYAQTPSTPRRSHHTSRGNSSSSSSSSAYGSGDDDSFGFAHADDDNVTASVASGCNPAELSTLLYAYSQLGRHPITPGWLRTFYKAVEDSLPSWAPQPLSNLLYACAKLQLQPPAALLDVYWQQALTQLPAYTPQALANSAWALAKLSLCPPEGLQQALLADASIKLPLFSAQELSNLIWAVATLKWTPGDTLLARFESESLDQLDQYNAQNLSNTLWALAQLQHRPGIEWQTAYSSQLAARASTMSAIQHADVLSSAVALYMRPDAAYIAMATTALAANLPSLSLRQLLDVLHALAKLRYKPPPAWLLLAADELLPPQLSFEPSMAVAAPAGTTAAAASQGANLSVASSMDADGEVGAVGSATQPAHPAASSSSGVRKVSGATKRRPVVDTDALTRGLAAFAALGHQPSASWMVRVLDALMPALPTMSAAALARMAAALAALRFAPPQPWLLRFVARVESLGMNSLQASELVAILDALPRLGFRGQEALLAALARPGKRSMHRM